MGFLCEFGHELYGAIDGANESLQALHLPYFTRIFSPDRDQMGAYVRLHFFLDGTRDDVGGELDARLAVLQSQNQVFQVRKEIIDGVQEAVLKGAGPFPDLYYEYMEFLSRQSIKLLRKSPADAEVDKILWSWTHNFFNLLRGYQVSVLEFPPGIPVRSLSI